jgi:three-Cys-motif partner protein
VPFLDNTVNGANADDLAYNDVGVWTEEKHRLVAYYASLFSESMKDKWHKRVYIELYAGAGYSRVRGTERVISGSPIQALALRVPFDKYIFCEQNPDKLEALRSRVKRHAPTADVSFVPGYCNESISEILDAIPKHSKSQSVLSLCFVDPNDIGIKFSTLAALSQRYVDFVVLLALYMDAQRAEQQYCKNPTKISELLGTSSWPERWIRQKQDGAEFPRFLAEEFADAMQSLKYIPPPFYKMRKVFLREKNYPLYGLWLFSRHPTAYSLWDQALKYSDDQMGLF